jgi:hypothetical protein
VSENGNCRRLVEPTTLNGPMTSDGHVRVHGRQACWFSGRDLFQKG